MYYLGSELYDRVSMGLNEEGDYVLSSINKLHTRAAMLVTCCIALSAGFTFISTRKRTYVDGCLVVITKGPNITVMRLCFTKAL